MMNKMKQEQVKLSVKEAEELAPAKRGFTIHCRNKFTVQFYI